MNIYTKATVQMGVAGCGMLFLFHNHVCKCVKTNIDRKTLTVRICDCKEWLMSIIKGIVWWGLLKYLDCSCGDHIKTCRNFCVHLFWHMKATSTVRIRHVKLSSCFHIIGGAVNTWHAETLNEKKTFREHWQAWSRLSDLRLLSWVTKGTFCCVSPSINHTIYPLRVIWGISKRWGTFWTGHHRADWETQTSIHAYRQFKVVNLPRLHVFGLWEEGRVPERNPHSLRENMQNPQWGQTWALRIRYSKFSCCTGCFYILRFHFKVMKSYMILASSIRGCLLWDCQAVKASSARGNPVMWNSLADGMTMWLTLICQSVTDLDDYMLAPLLRHIRKHCKVRNHS